MTSRNDITGKTMISMSSTDAYRSGWDRIFGSKKEAPSETVGPEAPTGMEVKWTPEDVERLDAALETVMNGRRKPTQHEKIKMYESVLHAIYFASTVEMNHEKVMSIFGRIAAWSYAHRQGNGEFSNAEQQHLINRAFWKLKDF